MGNLQRPEPKKIILEDYIKVLWYDFKSCDDFFDVFAEGKRINEGINYESLKFPNGKVRELFFYKKTDEMPFAYVDSRPNTPFKLRFYVDGDTWENRKKNFITSTEGIEYSDECPKCGTEPDEFDGDHFRVDGYDWPAFLHVHRGYDGWCDYVNWTEVHCCSECETKFAFDNGN